MIDDDAEYEQRRQIRAQADADVSEFIASLGEDEGSGVPPPPSIKVSEVSSQPVEFDFLGFGPQRSGTAPGAGSPPIGGGCVDMCVTFEGITSCGCINDLEYKIYHLEGLNGTYQLACISAGVWDLIIDNGDSCWNVDRFTGSCDGDPNDNISGPVHIHATFDGSDYVVWIQVESDVGSSAFFASGPGSSITDTNSCGDTTDVGLAVGISGTATIAFDPPCTPNPCPEAATGACCALDGSCLEMAEVHCIHGTYQGDGTVCDPNPCVAMGACCNFDDNTCAITSEADCVDPGVYFGDATTCDDCGF
jgi:hypothetical protein